MHDIQLVCQTNCLYTIANSRRCEHLPTRLYCLSLSAAGPTARALLHQKREDAVIVFKLITHDHCLTHSCLLLEFQTCEPGLLSVLSGTTDASSPQRKACSIPVPKMLQLWIKMSLCSLCDCKYRQLTEAPFCLSLLLTPLSSRIIWKLLLAVHE